METTATKKTTSLSVLTWWGTFLILAPIVGLILISFWRVILKLMIYILSGDVSVNVGTISDIETVMGILTLIEFVCIILGLASVPVGIILLIIGFVKKKEVK